MPGRGPNLSIDAAQRPLSRTGYGGLVLDRLVRHACILLGAERTAIFVRDDSDPRVVVPVAGHGIDEQLLGSRLAVDEGAVGLVLRTGKAMWLGSGQALSGAAARPAGPCAGAWAPIRSGHLVTGAFLAAPGNPSQRIDERGLDLLERLADLAAAALQDAPMRGRIEPAMNGGVTALEAALELADPRSAAHRAEVAGLSRRVGERMDLDPAALIELEMSARLFDVGRIAVGGRFAAHGPLPASVGPRYGPELGADLIVRVPGLEVVAIIVRHHGERWDGLGRPDGLSGERIPLASRVIAACEAYAILTSEGPGGAGLGWTEALLNVEAGAGSRFDPAVLESLEQVIESATPAGGA